MSATRNQKSVGVFGEINTKLRQHGRELDTANKASEKLGGQKVTADALGWWRLSFRSTTGPVVQLQARSGKELIALLEARTDRPPGDTPKAMKSWTRSQALKESRERREAEAKRAEEAKKETAAKLARLKAGSW